MKDPRFWGGTAAFVCAGTYIFGFVVLLTLLAPSGYGANDADPAAIAAFIAENTGLMIIWNLAIYVVNGLALAALAVTLGMYFAGTSPHLAQMVRSFGMLWATLVVGAGMVANVGIAAVAEKFATAPDDAVRIWEVISLVENGLGGGNEIAGSVWAILIAIAAMALPRPPRALALFSVVIGVSGLLTIIPQTGELPGAIFGLGYIVWFIWVGILLIRDGRQAQAGRPVSTAGLA
ncbi:hypothetical protein [Yoonia sp. SS1-5]|uniref:DUF4386 family protein n=1 Tax=Yoonia rhodophyticola TaxID=3137370 RepID=A0AAN0NKW1_9RHOB